MAKEKTKLNDLKKRIDEYSKQFHDYITKLFEDGDLAKSIYDENKKRSEKSGESLIYIKNTNGEINKLIENFANIIKNLDFDDSIAGKNDLYLGFIENIKEHAGLGIMMSFDCNDISNGRKNLFDSIKKPFTELINSKFKDGINALDIEDQTKLLGFIETLAIDVAINGINSLKEFIEDDRLTIKNNKPKFHKGYLTRELEGSIEQHLKCEVVNSKTFQMLLQGMDKKYQEHLDKKNPLLNMPSQPNTPQASKKSVNNNDNEKPADLLTGVNNAASLAASMFKLNANPFSKK